MRIRALALTATMAAALIAVPALGVTPKPGANCRKAGLTAVVKYRKYTCTRRSGKLVWNSGIDLPRPSASPSSSASPNPTPSTSSHLVGGMLRGDYLPGRTCEDEGAFGSWSGGGLFTCAKGVIRYAFPADLPPMPQGGYTRRPSWYPPLWYQNLDPQPSCTGASISFTSPVVPLDKMTASVPYGAMIGDHVTPIDHMYIGVKGLEVVASQLTDADYAPVMSPADGTVRMVGAFANGSGHPTYRVVIDHGCDVQTVYIVLNRLAGPLAYLESELGDGAYKYVRIPIKAGEAFGRQAANALDFNVFDGSQWLTGLANPLAYVYGEPWKPYTADPLPFFTPTIRAEFASHLQRTSEPRIGRIDHDVPGTLAGNWFLDGTAWYSGQVLSKYTNATGLVWGTADGKNIGSYGHLSVSRHWVDTTAWVFSIGSWQDSRGDGRQFVLLPRSGQPAPDRLSPADGLVTYDLYDWTILDASGAPPVADPLRKLPMPVGYLVKPTFARGIVAVRVNPDGSITVEPRPDAGAGTSLSAFTDAARTYRR